jgi:hypothetical protein
MDFQQLGFSVGPDFRPLPSWAGFFLRLGFSLGATARDHGQITVAVALPIRNYAAVLSAIGTVLARFEATTAVLDADQHFDLLCQQTPGTGVVLERDSRQFVGVVSRTETIAGQKFLRIQLQDQEHGGEAHYIPARDSLRVTITGVKTALPRKARGTAPIARRTFVRSLVGKHRARQFITQTDSACALIGKGSLLAPEISKTPLIIRRKGEGIAGKPGDILRVSQLLAPGRSHRCELLRSGAKSLLFLAPPSVVIFDGVQGFCKWQHLCRQSHILAIFDKTDPRFDDGVAVVNAALTNANVKPFTGLRIPSIPPAVDLAAFIQR